MKKKVYVNGIGMTHFGEHFGMDCIDLAVQSIEVAMADSACTMADIDAVYVGNMLGGVLNGQNHLSAHLAGRLGVHVPVYRIESACASGGMAMHMAHQSIAGGINQNVLVVGTESMTNAGTKAANAGLGNAASNDERNANIGFADLYGLMAGEYKEKYGLEDDVFWWSPALMHKQACENPKAQYKKMFTPEQISKSRMIAAPLRLLDCSPHTDGAAAVVLSTQKNDVEIVGSACCTDTPGLAERETRTSLKAVTQAWKKMQEAHAIDAKMIDVCEVHDCFSIASIIAMEDLEFAPRGEGWKILKGIYEGTKTDLMVNASGGLKACGHPVGATGVKQIVSLVEAMRKHKHTHGLTHNVGGTGGSAVLHYLKRA
jgi:acetyl-CoA C-acetyltransferase